MRKERARERTARTPPTAPLSTYGGLSEVDPGRGGTSRPQPKETVTTVYLDPSGTIVSRTRGRRLGEEHTTLLPGALEAIQRLCDQDYDVVVLSKRPLDPLANLRDGVRYEAAAPDELGSDGDRPRRGQGPTPRSWLIAADDGWGEWNRPAGMRTIRVGPRRSESHRPTARFDIEARDLGAAVLEILVQDTLET